MAPTYKGHVERNLTQGHDNYIYISMYIKSFEYYVDFNPNDGQKIH